MHHPDPNYRFEDFHAIQNIDDEGFLFNWSKTSPLAPLNKVFQPTNEQELRSILLGGYETVRLGDGHARSGTAAIEPGRCGAFNESDARRRPNSAYRARPARHGPLRSTRTTMFS